VNEMILASLAAECAVRLCGACHGAGGHRHHVSPDGRVRCFGPGREPPEGWPPSAAQEAYWRWLGGEK
jgi:hypothetical protein